ncbi:mucoidy inhibitor MuiA family protein [Candidatus Bathyarchaeota archaeon]|nr:mucoidy inhibitor MuiA family protein [Candidatus Bathyarchaeota archaeon]
MENTHTLEHKIEAPLKEVTVYKKGVKVTRKGEIDLKEGKQVVLLEFLPMNLDESSLKVNGRGAGRIENILIETQHEESTHAKRMNELVQAVDEQQRELELIDARKQFFEGKLHNLVSMQETYLVNYPFILPDEEQLKFLAEHEGKNPEAPGDEINTFLEQTTQLMEKTRKELKSASKEFEIKELHLKKLQKELEQLQVSGKTRVFRQIRLEVEARAAGTFTFTFMYVLHAGSWNPMYDVALDDDDERVRVTLMASVINNTSEDWQDVNLTLSTADLNPVRIIEPKPWILRERTSQIATRKPEPAKAPGLSLGGSHFARADDATLQQEASQGGSPLGVTTYKMPSSMSLKHGSFPHVLHLKEFELPAKMEYMWSCTREHQVIVQNLITNGDSPLLPGRVRIFIDENLTGETYLDGILPGEEFTMGTRESLDIKVEKKLKDRSTEKAGFTKGKVEREYLYEITVENMAERPNDLILMDRIPHSDSEEIKVKIDGELIPEPEEFRLGIIKWRIHLKDKPRKFSISYKFTVSYDREVRLETPLP